MESLSSGDVDTIGQGSNDQSWSVTKIFIGVPERSVGNVTLSHALFLVVDELQLGLPLELVGFPDVFSDELVHNVSGVSIQSDHAHDLLSKGFIQVTLHQLDETDQIEVSGLLVVLEGVKVTGLDSVEAVFD